VSETWFVSDLCESLIVCDSFNLFHSDRSGRGGGVAIYVNKNLNSKLVCTQSIEIEIEWMFINIFNKRDETNNLLGIQNYGLC